MNTHKFVVEEMRFHLNVPDTLVFVGWFYDGSTRDRTLTVQFDGRKLPVEKLLNKGVEICQKYIHCVNEIGEEVVGIVKLPPDWRKGHRLSVWSSYKGTTHRDAVYSVKRLLRLENQVGYCIGEVSRTDGKLVVSGWCQGNGEIKLSFFDAEKQPLAARIDRAYKKDLEQVGPEDEKREKLFFSAEIACEEWKGVCLEIRNASGAELVRLDRWNDDSKAARLWRKLKNALLYFRRNGVKATLVRTRDRVRHRLTHGRDVAYAQWLKEHGVTAQELEEQRTLQAQMRERPRFSVAVPLYRTEETFLRELIGSLQSQTYENWELCLADGSEDGGEGLSAIVSEYQKEDGRIRYQILEKNYGISRNMNAAMEMAEGDFVALVDHDDTLAPDALFEFAKVVNEDPSVQMLYSDEDKTDETGSDFSEPHFKPDFDLDLLLSNNYICHLLAVKRDLLRRVGGFRSEFDGSQDYDFILRCCEEAERIYHVPKVLYHWRCHEDSTAENPESKLYAYEAGRRAVEAHYERLQIPARVVHAEFKGLYRTHYQWPDQPLVSVIVPNTDHVEALSGCVESVLQSDYSNYEIVIVENGSREKETFLYYEKLKSEHTKIRVVNYEGPYNLSGINNRGETAASGDYLLLLNSEARMTDRHCMRELLGHCMRADVGVVGAKILGTDDTIWHAGIILGTDGQERYVFRGKSRYAAGYQSRVICPQNYSAVTALCMMVKREVYKKAGGMTEELPERFGDIDFCLKVRALGWLIAYNPRAEIVYCGENQKNTESAETAGRAQEIFCRRWEQMLKAPDPYYNCNLALDAADFSLCR